MTDELERIWKVVVVACWCTARHMPEKKNNEKHPGYLASRPGFEVSICRIRFNANSLGALFCKIQTLLY
jgi:hypothetical protein